MIHEYGTSLHLERISDYSPLPAVKLVFFQKIFVVLAQAVVLYTTHSNKLFHLFPHKEVTSLLPRMFLIHNMEDDTMQLRFYAFELF